MLFLKFLNFKLDIIKIQRGLDNTYSEKYCTLKFEHVSLQDAKKYVCSVKDDDNTIYSLFYYDLVIKSKEEPEIIDLNLDNSSTPRIVENPSEVNLNLTCFVSGEPKEKINWLKDGIELNRHDSNDTSLGVEHIIPNTNNQKLFVKSLPVIGKVTYRCQRSYFDSYQILQSKKIESHESNSINSKFFIVLIIMSTFVVITCNLIYLKKREHKIQKRCLQEAGLLQKSDSELNTYLQLNPQEIVQNQVDKLFYDTKWEFNKKRLKLGEKLGNGAFGIVLKAEAYGICSGEETTTVAVKMLHPYADASQVRALASELKVMIYLGKHLNIVNLLGACTDNISKRELYIIVEYCQQGNLHEYLLSNRDSFNDQIYPNSDENSPLKSTFDIHDLISWSYQLARGMEYLSLKKILHGDLAARNVLLTETKIVKICDFGLSRMLYQDESYIKSNRGLLPIRWMSIEAIRDRVFSTQSDVWSYGIVLWEFFSLAEVPYYDVHSDKILTKLLDGYRLKKPEHATENIYEIMLDCWKKNPASRPTFTILVNRMDNMIASYVKTYYTNFTASYETLNVEDPE